MTARTIPVREWVVTARYPEPFVVSVPVYGIDATTPEHAVMQVQGMRDRLKLPKDCTYSARAVDTGSYEPLLIDSGFALFDRAMPRELRSWVR